MGTNSSRWRRIFLKRNTTLSCRKTSALSLRIFSIPLPWISDTQGSGSNVGPDFGEGDNPSNDAFKTKAEVVKFVQEAVADGAQVIHQQGDAGLDNTSKFFGNRLAHDSAIWTFAIEHSGEHYGPLTIVRTTVPPASRR